MAKRRNSRDSDYSLRRRGATRDPLPRILVVCEGEVTEAGYFDEFRRAERNPAVTVEIDSRSGDPRALVERARSQMEAAAGRARREGDPNLGFDEVWCVFDVDQHAGIGEARETARKSGIQLAVSNPCFELWALLHFEDHGAHATCDGLSRRLRHHAGDYRKQLPFSRLFPGYADAVRRAGDLERRHERDGTPNENPSTGVHHLTEQIRRYGREERLSRGWRLACL